MTKNKVFRLSLRALERQTPMSYLVALGALRACASAFPGTVMSWERSGPYRVPVLAVPGASSEEEVIERIGVFLEEETDSIVEASGAVFVQALCPVDEKKAPHAEHGSYYVSKNQQKNDGDDKDYFLMIDDVLIECDKAGEPIPGKKKVDPGSNIGGHRLTRRLRGKRDGASDIMEASGCAVGSSFRKSLLCMSKFPGTSMDVVVETDEDSRKRAPRDTLRLRQTLTSGWDYADTTKKQLFWDPQETIDSSRDSGEREKRCVRGAYRLAVAGFSMFPSVASEDGIRTSGVRGSDEVDVWSCPVWESEVGEDAVRSLLDWQPESAREAVARGVEFVRFKIVVSNPGKKEETRRMVAV
jgi:hypothetical protein